ncbi:MAG: flavodoxin family protein [Desulfohalobiaceae bacterium]|nr:flavodoxin family protein [Desulfohalobiaceae bacterium]
MILAVHSSPIQDGNLERMVKRVALASGHRFELIELHELGISPCRGCVCCATSKRCVQEDDMEPLYDKLETMDGFILGGVNYNGRLNSLAHIFLERLFPLYHQEPVFRDLPAAVVAVGGKDPDRAAGDMIEYLRDIYFFQVVGSALYASDTPPAFPAVWERSARWACRP